MARDKRLRSTGRSGKSSRFIMLPLSVFKSKACMNLSHAHFRLLMALAADYNGKNNGALALTRPQAREAGIGSNRTVSEGLRDLEARGLIVRTDPGMVRPPRPARFAVTWKDVDSTDFTERSGAAHTYRYWSPSPRSEKTVPDAYSGCPDGPTEDARKVIYL